MEGSKRETGMEGSQMEGGGCRDLRGREAVEGSRWRAQLWRKEVEGFQMEGAVEGYQFEEGDGEIGDEAITD